MESYACSFVFAIHIGRILEVFHSMKGRTVLQTYLLTYLLTYLRTNSMVQDIATQLVKKYPDFFMEPEGSSPCS